MHFFDLLTFCLLLLGVFFCPAQAILFYPKKIHLPFSSFFIQIPFVGSCGLESFKPSLTLTLLLPFPPLFILYDQWVKKVKWSGLKLKLINTHKNKAGGQEKNTSKISSFFLFCFFGWSETGVSFCCTSRSYSNEGFRCVERMLCKRSVISPHTKLRKERSENTWRERWRV